MIWILLWLCGTVILLGIGAIQSNRISAGNIFVALTLSPVVLVVVIAVHIYFILSSLERLEHITVWKGNDP